MPLPPSCAHGVWSVRKFIGNHATCDETRVATTVRCRTSENKRSKQGSPLREARPDGPLTLEPISSLHVHSQVLQYCKKVPQQHYSYSVLPCRSNCCFRCCCRLLHFADVSRALSWFFQMPQPYTIIGLANVMAQGFILSQLPAAALQGLGSTVSPPTHQWLQLCIKLADIHETFYRAVSNSGQYLARGAGTAKQRNQDPSAAFVHAAPHFLTARLTP